MFDRCVAKYVMPGGFVYEILDVRPNFDEILDVRHLFDEILDVRQMCDEMFDFIFIC